MKRLAQAVLAGVLLLLVGVSLAAAQARPPVPAAEPQPVMRLGGGYIEVANDLFMHVIALSDIRYTTTENRDFEHRVRDRTNARAPDSVASFVSDCDCLWELLRFGAEFRYQKNLTMHMQYEFRMLIDGNTMDDRANSTNPGGTNVFGVAATTENPGFRPVAIYIDYKFEGTPLRMRVGGDIWSLDQAGLVGRHDPRAAVFGDFGDVDAMAAIVFKRQALRLGYENNNDYLFYTFSAGYNLRPHRFQFDVVYFHDRFTGAQMQAVGLAGGDGGWTGQKSDSVLIMPSWTGRVGPVLGLIQGHLVLGTAHGGTLGLPAAFKVAPGRKYDIFAGGVVAYGEVDLGIVRPFVGLFWGSADGDPNDKHLHGFSHYPQGTSTQFTGVPTFAHFDTASAIGARDYACPARLQGLQNRASSGILASNPLAVGTGVMGALTANNIECWHDVTYAFNDRIGRFSTPGLNTTYSNAGTLMIPAGVKVFPLKGHEITGGYAYRGIVNSKLLEIAFQPEMAARGLSHIGKGSYHEAWAYWLWTLNPYFDIRLAGSLGFAANGSKDLARLSVCNPGGVSGTLAPTSAAYKASTPCHGDDVARKVELRFRARF